MAYCDRCGRHFGSEHALEQHRENSSAHNVCDDCDKDFRTYDALKQHWSNTRRHHYCRSCDEHFDDEEDLEKHFEDAHFYCSPCGVFFHSAYLLHEHNRQSHHYCPDCRRHFQSDSNLQHHRRSTLHAGASVPCPGNKCRKMFVSGAALVLHLESGTCPSRVTRDAVNRVAAKYDTQHVITNPARMIAYGEGGTGSVVTWATERAWNGWKYECFLCHREFHTLAALNQHLASPAHEDKMYRCPRGYSGCGAEFKTLSALCQHVESEQCNIRRFNRKMQDYLGDLTSNMKRLGI
ncbi:hypothetical protein DAEQUDRAFT_726665 [Daedalea quercina L-15889]|uniref:C2H2-type domain-containing protein n=1 Tax=Daedalea quercina L-15889 TaxID=1314783 RepID=A0A165QF31_9APHY|nr:hypothetical protein DAEQUDRAFT_726665 [Daedalea quercina L-15889]